MPTSTSISFGLKDPRPALAEARKLSVSDALEQAELYAEAAGVRRPRPQRVAPAMRSTVSR